MKSSGRSAPPTRRLPLWLAATLLVLATLAAYHNSFGGAFVFDDPPSIAENATLRDLSDWRSVLSPPAGAGVGGRPLANLTYALNYALGGTAVAGYHAGNLALHVFAALALFGLVRRTLLLPVLRDRFGAAATALALAIAALWALHPLQTTTVDYLSQRTEGLMGLCYLLTLYCFARSTAVAAARCWSPLAVLACAAGMASKEVMITAPVLALLYDRTFVAGSFVAAWRARWKTYLAFAATWVLLALLLAGVEQRGVGFGQNILWWRYAVAGCYAYVTYFRLSWWPDPLVFDYGPNVIDHVFLPPYVAAVVTTAGLTALALWRASRLAFLACWFLLIPAPTSSIVPISRQLVAENRAYLALAAVLTGFVLALHHRLGRRSFPVLVALALGCGLVTVRRHADYRTAVSLWSDTVAKQPDNWRAHNILALALAETGRTAEGIAQLRLSLTLRPDLAETHHNLGVLLERRGELTAALTHYNTALDTEPWRADSQNNLANLLCQLGRPDEAIRHYEIALRLNPNLAEAENGFGNALLQQGRVAEAIRHYETALRLNPAHADSHNNLGQALIRLGRPAEAAAAIATAVRLRPDSAGLHANLANILAALGRLPDALAAYETALRLDPNLASAHNNYARVLAATGRGDEARRHLETAVLLDPGYADAHCNLGVMLAAAGSVAEARAHFVTALRLRPDFAAAHTGLAALPPEPTP